MKCLLATTVTSVTSWSISGPTRDHELVGPDRKTGLVAPDGVERQAVGRRPERARVHTEQPNLIGKPMNAQRLAGRQGCAARHVVHPDPGRNRWSAVTIPHVEHEMAELRGDLGHATPLDGDVT